MCGLAVTLNQCSTRYYRKEWGPCFRRNAGLFLGLLLVVLGDWAQPEIWGPSNWRLSTRIVCKICMNTSGNTMYGSYVRKIVRQQALINGSMIPEAFSSHDQLVNSTLLEPPLVMYSTVVQWLTCCFLCTAGSLFPCVDRSMHLLVWSCGRLERR